MRLERATDAVFMNALANHSAVRPHIPGRGEVELTPLISDPNNVALRGQHGGMFFHQVVSGCYEIHTLILPEGRGEWGVEFARACVRWLFLRTNAVEVYTRVPKGNIAALALTKICGAKHEHTVVQDIAGEVIEIGLWGGRIQDWLKIDPELPALGFTFHNLLKSKYARLGVILPTHPDDPWHDRHVGAAAGMITGGQVIKGILVYNRWAALAIAPQIRLISADPVVIDITECRIEIKGDDFEVILKG